MQISREIVCYEPPPYLSIFAKSNYLLDQYGFEIDGHFGVQFNMKSLSLQKYVFSKIILLKK